MSYFTQDYLNFLTELTENNNRDWFNDHKKRFKDNVEAPFKAFLQDLIDTASAADTRISITPKEAMFRIYKDTRFSKDKTPYNTHFFAHITKGTKENPIAGIAFRFSGNDSGIMTGYYKPTKEKLTEIRQKINGNLSEFQRLKTDKNFIEKFGSIQGEAYKRIPPELQSTFEKEPLIANKQFYYVAEKDAKFALSDNLNDVIVDYWLTAKPLNDFFS